MQSLQTIAHPVSVLNVPTCQMGLKMQKSKLELEESCHWLKDNILLLIQV